MSQQGHSEIGEKRTLLERTRETLMKPSVISVFVLVALWNLTVESKLFARWAQRPGGIGETIADIRNVNLHLQLRFYQLLMSHRPITMQPGAIRFAYIDDEVHWTNLYGEMPTSRSFLAKLIHNASQPATKALAIGLDVALLAPREFPAGSDWSARAAANAELKAALHYASSQGVPVVLATAYYIKDVTTPKQSKGEHQTIKVRLPNIFTDNELPLQNDKGQCPAGEVKTHGLGQTAHACVTFGYINPPDDRREIGLSEKIYDPESNQTKLYDSFGLALAKAVEGWPALIEAYPTFRSAEDDGKSIFGSFLKESEFKKVDTQLLADGEAGAEGECAGKILLIGGSWHDMQGYGQAVDAHLSPVGTITGVAFHANYVESLLQRQFTTELNVWAGVIIDLFVGLLIYMAFEAIHGLPRFGVLAAAAIIPPLIAYIFLGLWNKYLDFLLPVELYTLHIIYEMIDEYWRIKRTHKRSRIELDEKELDNTEKVRP